MVTFNLVQINLVQIKLHELESRLLPEFFNREGGVKICPFSMKTPSSADDNAVHAITRYVIKTLRTCTIVRVILVNAYEGTQSDLSGKRELGKLMLTLFV